MIGADPTDTDCARLTGEDAFGHTAKKVAIGHHFQVATAACRHLRR